MAHLDTLSVRSLHRPSILALVERVLLRHVTAQALEAQAQLSVHEGLSQRLAKTLMRRRLPSQAGLSWYLSARASAARTVEELSEHSDRELADIQVPRELIRSVAVVAAFGWPREDERKVFVAETQNGVLSRLRRTWFPTQAELEETYLAGAADLHELEYRMTEWDRRRVGRRTALSL